MRPNPMPNPDPNPNPNPGPNPNPNQACQHAAVLDALLRATIGLDHVGSHTPLGQLMCARSSFMTDA